jgi:signal transduction histidine kinase
LSVQRDHSRSARERVGGEREGKRLVLAVDLPSRLPIYGDPQRLRQMLDNVFSNAVKYSHKSGVIDVGLALHAGVATLTIADTALCNSFTVRTH